MLMADRDIDLKIAKIPGKAILLQTHCLGHLFISLQSLIPIHIWVAGQEGVMELYWSM